MYSLSIDDRSTSPQGYCIHNTAQRSYKRQETIQCTLRNTGPCHLSPEAKPRSPTTPSVSPPRVSITKTFAAFTSLWESPMTCRLRMPSAASRQYLHTRYTIHDTPERFKACVSTTIHAAFVHCSIKPITDGLSGKHDTKSPRALVTTAATSASCRYDRVLH